MFASVSKILCVNVSVLVCAAKFHFQFCRVYPADSLQSVDKESAMTARANVAELLERLTEKVKLMAVTAEQLFRRGQICRDSMAVLQLKRSPLTNQLNRTRRHVGVEFPPIIAHQMSNLNIIQNIIMHLLWKS